MKNKYKYIIYKIFTSKYKDLFILDGSYGLYLSVKSINSRELGDLDLNDTRFVELVGENTSKNNGEGWKSLINNLNEIFNEDDVVVKYKYHSNNVRAFNNNSIGSKIVFLIDGEEINVDISLIFDDVGAYELTWNVKDDEDFCKENNFVKEEKVKIRRFENEKIVANKILAIIKETNTLEAENVDISKSLYDVWFVINVLSDINLEKLNNQFKLMYKDYSGMNTTFQKLANYIDLHIVKFTHNMDLYIYQKSNNKDLSGYSLIIDLINFFKMSSIKGENYV